MLCQLKDSGICAQDLLHIINLQINHSSDCGTCMSGVAFFSNQETVRGPYWEHVQKRAPGVACGPGDDDQHVVVSGLVRLVTEI